MVNKPYKDLCLCNLDSRGRTRQIKRMYILLYGNKYRGKKNIYIAVTGEGSLGKECQESIHREGAF